jgi:hypothetical protein
LLRGFVFVTWICLFVCFFSFTISHPEGVCRQRKDKENRLPPLRASPNIRNPPPPACAVRKSRGMGPPYMILIVSCGKNEKRWQSTRYPPHLPPSSLVSQTIHWSNLVPWASSTSRPSTVLPIPEISKNRKNRPSHRGFDSRTRTLHEDLYLLRGFETMIAMATRRGNPSTVQLLMERGAIPAIWNDRGDTVLHCPPAGGSAATVGLFLEAGLNNEATDLWGETPLHHAAKFHRYDYVFELLQRGANVDAFSIEGRTPLQAILSWSRSTSAARHILHHDTLPEGCASKGSQACVPGYLFGESDIPVVDLLLSAGADIRASRDYPRSPLRWAASLLNIMLEY